jgi:hypothetical protein
VARNTCKEVSVLHRRAIGLFIVGLALAGCGDNITSSRSRSGVQSSMSGGMVATSQHYRIVSTVTSGEVSADSANLSVRAGITGEGAAQ